MRILVTAVAAVALTSAAHADQFRIGPGGVRVKVQEEYYQDGHHQRHAFEVPMDWRDYHHPLGWYRVHRQWWRASDWYRRDGSGIDAATPQSDIRQCYPSPGAPERACKNASAGAPPTP